MVVKMKSFFPANKGRWIQYTLTSLPIIFAAMIFTMNSFVDNFMAIVIPYGNQSLSFANQWTSMINGIIAATTLIGSALFGQYLGAGDRVKIREVLRGRMTIALSISICFAIPGVFAPNFMIDVISGFDKNLSVGIKSGAADYLSLISITWIMYAWGFTTAMILRESGYGNASLISAIISLLLNIILNAIFIYVLKTQDIKFLAYSTIISNVVTIFWNATFIWIKDRRIIVNPFKLLLVSKTIWMQFGKRIGSFLMLSLGSIFVNIRFIFWNIGFPTGSISKPEYGLNAGIILGISGMFFNIFWTTFESLNANIAIYVGRELGKNNIQQAKSNAKELQGFHAVVALSLGIILFSFSFAIEKMDFLADGYRLGLQEHEVSKKLTPEEIANASSVLLNKIKLTLWPLSWMMPFWIWYITKARLIAAGGMTKVVAMMDTFGGMIQTSWIVLINFIIIPNSHLDFPWAYAIFFLSDFIKLIIYEILYYKLNWAKNVTSEGEVVRSLE